MMARRATMSRSKKSEWMVPLALFILAALPLIPGAFRLGGGAAVLPANPRVLAMPLPVVIHIISAAIYTLVGALQFAPAIRRVRPALHRWTGRLILPFGLAAAVTGLWMTLVFPPAPEY